MTLSKEPEELPLRTGDMVAGRYLILDLLGEGGMGAVFKAEQMPLKREVAVKVIRPDRAHRQQARDRFLREARVTAALRHPGVVEIYDYGEHKELLYLAMEMLEGDALRRWVDYDLPLMPLERVLKIAIAVADVLVAAAQVPLVHRDLKPENIMIHRPEQPDERVVVVDFGLAFLQAG